MTDTNYSVQVEGSRSSFCNLFIFEGHLALATGDGVMYLDRAAHQRLNEAIRQGFAKVEAIKPVEVPLPGEGELELHEAITLQEAITGTPAELEEGVAL